MDDTVGQAAMKLAKCFSALMAFAVPIPIAAQSMGPRPDHAIAWQAVGTDSAPTISGKVFNTAGQPVQDASVIVQGTGLGDITGPDGSFSFAAPAGGRWALGITALGYLSAMDTVEIMGVHGIQILALLAPAYAPMCGLVIGPEHGELDDLRITVTDSSSNTTPNATVTLRVIRGTEIKSATHRLSPRDPAGSNIIGIGQRIEQAGYYTIEVVAEGYHTWQEKNAWLELTNPCHPVLLGGARTVKLVPKSRE